MEIREFFYGTRVCREIPNSENRNCNFGYKFVHTRARVMILMASDRAQRGASEDIQISPKV